MKLYSQDECISALETYYKEWDGLGLAKQKHKGFEGCVQWHFTPESVFDINRIYKENKTWGVIINIEAVHYLLKRGVDKKDIKFFSDCEWRSTWAIKIAKLDPSNVIRLPTQDKKILKGYIKMAEKTVDYVLNNVPFGMFKQFKDLAQKQAREKALIIAGSRDYHGGTAFENVEYYKYLGECFPTAKVTASVSVVNPNGVTSLTIVDGDGVFHQVAPNPAVAPGEDFNVWEFAMNVISKNLPGYLNPEKGGLNRKDSIIDSNGIPVIFSAGRAGEDFTADNQASTTQQLAKDNTKYCWAKVKDDPNIGGKGIHKVVVTHTANEPGHLGNPKYAGPDWGCGINCWYIPCDSEDDANECIKYLKHPDVIKLVKGLKAGVATNSKAVWKRIPHHSQAANWIPNYA